MMFEHPRLLYGLILLAVPILIHFLNFHRTRTVYFSSLKFLREAETSRRNRRRIQDVFLLILRLLILACIILAFAKPVWNRIPGTIQTGSLVGLYLDNSYSMELVNEGETLLESGKTEAEEIIRSYPPDTRFLLVTNGLNLDFEGISDQQLALERVEVLEPEPYSANIADILKEFQSLSDGAGRKISALYLLSDFTQGFFQSLTGVDTSGIPVFPVPLRSNLVSNISVDSCWFDRPLHQKGQTDVLKVKISNHSDQDFRNLPVKLIINDSLRNETGVELTAGSSSEISIPFTIQGAGWQKGRVSISDYPYEYDNDLWFTYRIEAGISVLLLFDQSPNPYFRQLFRYDPYFRADEFTVKGFPRSGFDGYQAVILAGIHSFEGLLSDQVRSYLNAGGVIWFFPETTGQLISYNEFLASLNLPTIHSIATYTVESRLGSNMGEWLRSVVVNPDKRIRMPVFNQTFKFINSGRSRSDLLTTVGGDIILSRFRAGNGTFVLSAFPLEGQATDLMYHPLFIPFTYLITTSGLSHEKLYCVAGHDEPADISFTLRPDAGSVILVNALTGEETHPSVKPGFGGKTHVYLDYVPVPGHYELRQSDNSVAWVAYNLDRIESELNYLPDSVIMDKFTQAGWSVNHQTPQANNFIIKPFLPENHRKSLWHYFLLAALILLVTESLVMHRKK